MASSSGGATHESHGETRAQLDKTVTLPQLRDEMNRWLEGGTIEGQRRARIIRAVAAYEANTSVDRKELRMILDEAETEIRPQGLSDGELNAFLRVMSRTDSQAILENVVCTTSREREHWGEEWRRRGQRGRYLQSAQALGDFATKKALPIGLIDEKPGEAMLEWETEARHRYNVMAEAYNARAGRLLNPEAMVQYRMLRVASVLCGLSVHDTAEKTISMLQWINFAEPRLGVGLTQADWNVPAIKDFMRTEEGIAQLEAGGAKLRPDAARLLQRDLDYAQAAKALDAYLKDQKAFPEYLKKISAT